MKYKNVNLHISSRYRNYPVFSLEGIGFLLLGLAFALFVGSRFVLASADGFTDVFYTNSFRGSFEWFKKMDWLGMVVQAVISVFSLVGVSLIVIRIMTSMLYLSAKGLWEEVHDLKQQGGESEMYDLGLLNMAKTWAKGKSGTGLDAILGAVLVLLPDVKRYSDFGEKSGQNFDQDTSISQYMLKIALPTILAVFFLAMGFNGTLVKGLAVTVDAMGTLADRAVSVNYSGFIEDLVNSGVGYKFIFSASGSNEGKLTQQIATDAYGRAVTQIRGASANQLYTTGQNIEAWVPEAINTAIEKSTSLTEEVRNGLTNEETRDEYMRMIGFDIEVNGSESDSGCAVLSLDGSGAFSGLTEQLGEASVQRPQYLHLYIRQNQSAATNYFNIDG